ncbi:MAG: hypothetical protein AVDCRST_MAG88-3294, partial [uncultured Thermomicrobiales bacterium]
WSSAPPPPQPAGSCACPKPC